MAGVQFVTGVQCQRIDEQGVHVLVPEPGAAAPEAGRAASSGAGAGGTARAAGTTAVAEAPALRELLVPADTVVLCAGQESRAELVDELQGERPVHVVGGAHVASELDAKRATKEAVELPAPRP